MRTPLVRISREWGICACARPLICLAAFKWCQRFAHVYRAKPSLASANMPRCLSLNLSLVAVNSAARLRGSSSNKGGQAAAGATATATPEWSRPIQRQSYLQNVIATSCSAAVSLRGASRCNRLPSSKLARAAGETALSPLCQKADDTSEVEETAARSD